MYVCMYVCQCTCVCIYEIALFFLCSAYPIGETESFLSPAHSQSCYFENFTLPRSPARSKYNQVSLLDCLLISLFFFHSLSWMASFCPFLPLSPLLLSKTILAIQVQQTLLLPTPLVGHTRPATYALPRGFIITTPPQWLRPQRSDVNMETWMWAVPMKETLIPG